MSGVRDVVRALAGLSFSDIFELSPDALIVTDGDGRIVVANSEAESLFGWPSGSLAGESIEALVPEDTKDLHPGLRDGYLLDPSPRQMAPARPRVVGRRRDGSVFPCSISLSPMELDERTFVIAAVRDLTERVQLETQLLQAQKLDTVGRLAGGIAHDFNNLISVINATAELASTQLPKEHSVRDDLDIIREAGTRAATLTRQLLAFSRRQTLQPRVVDVNEVIRQLTPMVRRLIGEDVEIVLRLDETLAPAKLDPSQLEQVIVNLAANGRDAMPDGGTLSIETAAATLDAEASGGRFVVVPGEYVMVAVSDTGIGMDAETRQKIFEPFFTTKPLGVGTGLGLSTVYGIVKQSGGYVWCYSEPGHGTTFKIYFPRNAGPAEAGSLTPVARSAGGNETVLVVEDDDVLRGVVRRMLESAGYRAVEAHSGEDAVEAATGHDGRIDMVFSDVVMPGLGPSEMKERILAAQPHARFLFTSGYTSERIGVRGVIEGEMNFIGKPYSLEQLRTKVRGVLDAG